MSSPVSPLDGSPLQMRLLGVDDAEILVELDELCFGAEAWSLVSFVKELRRPHSPSCFLGLWGGDRLLAYSGAWIFMNFMDITTVGVHPQAQGHGLSHIVLAHLMYEGHRLGVESGSLEVRVNNGPALALYKRFGFKTQGRRKNYYADGSDAFVMSVEGVNTPQYGALCRSFMLEQERPWEADYPPLGTESADDEDG